MFNSTHSFIIAAESSKYLSFPDIIKSPITKDKLFLIYREGDSHHPSWSKLVLWTSYDNGVTWEWLSEFYSDIDNNGGVWNCPRMSYIGNSLYIICDQKNSTREKTAQFKIIHIISEDEGKSFTQKITVMPGMVPDKIIAFKGNLFCANHKIKSYRNDLIQLVSWSRDSGETWYDTNIMAHDNNKHFCEASVVNMGDYLTAYLRENSCHMRYVYTVNSTDGIHWSKPKKISLMGQRVTALRDEDKDNYIVGVYRNTKKPIIQSISNKLNVTMFEHNLDNGKIKLSHIDEEYPENQYHFGYAGLVRTDPDKYIASYYIKKRRKNPYIKLSFLEKISN